MSDTHAALRAFCAEGPIAWPAAEGIWQEPGGEPCIAGTGIEVALVALTAANIGLAQTVELWSTLTPAQGATAVGYQADHAALYRAADWRMLMEDSEAGAALVVAVRALLAERDAYHEALARVYRIAERERRQWPARATSPPGRAEEG